MSTTTATEEESFVDQNTDHDETETQTPTSEEKAPASPSDQPWQKPLTEMAEILRKQAEPKTQERQPTQDEINEYWGVYNPTKSKPDFFEKFFRLAPDMDPQEKAKAVQELQQYFGDFQNGLMRQSVTATQRLLEAELQKLRQEFQPMQQTVTQTRAEKLRSDFNTEYPALSDAKYNKILLLKAEELKDQNFDSPKSYFKALAEGAAKDLSDLTGQPFDLGAVQLNPKTTVTPSRLPRTSAGGTGGSGGGRQAVQKVEPDDSATLDWMK